MREENQLKEKYGTTTGFTVPENYFEELNSKILSSLPPYKEAPKHVELSRWQRFKPYLYLAAMFCGIWLMMKVFHNVSSGDRLSLDNPPAAIVQLIDDGEYDYDYYLDMPEETDYYIEDEVSENYDSIEEFENDFGYSLKPEYANYVITTTSGGDSNV